MEALQSNPGVSILSHKDIPIVTIVIDKERGTSDGATIVLDSGEIMSLPMTRARFRFGLLSSVIKLYKKTYEISPGEYPICYIIKTPDFCPAYGIFCTAERIVSINGAPFS